MVKKILSFVTRTEDMYPLSSKLNKKIISSILIIFHPLYGARLTAFGKPLLLNYHYNTFKIICQSFETMVQTVFCFIDYLK